MSRTLIRLPSGFSQLSAKTRSSAAGLLRWVFPLRSQEKAPTLQIATESSMCSLVRGVQPDWEYFMTAPATGRDVRESRLFPSKLDYVHSHGCIAGSLGGRLMAAVAVDLGVHEKLVEGSPQGRKVTRTPTSLFRGFFVSVMQPTYCEGVLTLKRNQIESSTAPGFEDLFLVTAEGGACAEKILTAEIKQTLTRLCQRWPEVAFSVAFRECSLHLVLPAEISLFRNSLLNANWQASGEGDAVQVIRLRDFLRDFEVGADGLPVSSAA